MNKLSLPTWLRDTDRDRGLRLECGRLVDLRLAVHRHRGVQLGLGVEEGEELEAGRGLGPPAHRRRDARGAWHRRVVARAANDYSAIFSQSRILLSSHFSPPVPAAAISLAQISTAFLFWCFTDIHSTASLCTSQT